MDSVAPAATITWHIGNSGSNNSTSQLTETDVKDDGLVSTHSSLHFLSSSYSGQNLTCIVEHPSLEAPDKNTVHIPLNSMLFLSKKYFLLLTQNGTAFHLFLLSLIFFQEPHCWECL